MPGGGAETLTFEDDMELARQRVEDLEAQLEVIHKERDRYNAILRASHGGELIAEIIRPVLYVAAIAWLALQIYIDIIMLGRW